MNASRLAVWIVGAAVSGAWLASAAGITRQARSVRAVPTPPDVVQFDALAGEVQGQARRLRDRLANAPAPRQAVRNPFSFSSSSRSPRSAVVPREPSIPVATTATVPPPPAEPSLDLIGIAASKNGDVIVRTAMMTGPYGDLIMVTAGQRILSRYDVVSVADDAVELKDVESGAVRRLILR